MARKVYLVGVTCTTFAPVKEDETVKNYVLNCWAYYSGRDQ